MLPNQVKLLVDKYCMGRQPESTELDVIIDMANQLGADPSELTIYMKKVQAGPTKEQVEAARKAKEEAERKAREAAEKKAAEARQKAEAEAKAKAKADAERKAKEEAERKEKAIAYKKAQEEAERKTEEEVRKKAENLKKSYRHSNIVGNIILVVIAVVYIIIGIARMFHAPSSENDFGGWITGVFFLSIIGMLAMPATQALKTKYVLFSYPILLIFPLLILFGVTPALWMAIMESILAVGIVGLFFALELSNN